jgi:hypothetical protein
MKKAVIIRFRHDTTTQTGALYAKGAEFELPSPDVAHNLYGGDIEILRYADGDDYELSLRQQAAERNPDPADVPEKADAKTEKKP